MGKYLATITVEIQSDDKQSAVLLAEAVRKTLQDATLVDVKSIPEQITIE